MEVRMDASNSSWSFPINETTDSVILETISSSSDFSDSAVSSFPDRMLREQNRKQIMYCFSCQQIYGVSCWNENHMVFDISDLIQVAIGPHIIPFYETMTNVDRALDQRNKYGGALNSVKASLQRIKVDVEAKIVENNRQMAALLVSKNEITSYRDNFLSVRESTASDREQFRYYMEECADNFQELWTSAAKLEQQYLALDQVQLKLSIDGRASSNLSTSTCIDGPFHLLDALDLELSHPERYSAADDVRRIVAYTLATSDKSDNERNVVVSRQAQDEPSEITVPSPAPRTTRQSPPLLVQPVHLPPPPPPPVRQSELSVAVSNIPRSSPTPHSISVSGETRVQRSSESSDYDVSSDEYPTSIPPLPPALPTSPPPQRESSSAIESSSSDQQLPASSHPGNGEIQNASNQEEDVYAEVPDAAPTDGGRFAADRIRNFFKNTCSWHPHANWLVSTSDGADAIIWIFPSDDKKKKVTETTASTPNLSSGIDKNGNRPIRVRLDHYNDSVCQMAWNPTGSILATGSKSGVIRFWSIVADLSTRRSLEAEAMEERHENDVLVLKFSPSGEYLISGGIDAKMLAWDVESLQHRQTFAFHSSPVCDVDWKNDSSVFVSCSYDGRIIISRIGQHQPLRSIIGYPRWIKSVRWSINGELLASCSVDTTLEVWKDGSENSEPDEFSGHTRSVNAIAWRPVPSSGNVTTKKKDVSSNQFLASGSDDGMVILFNLTTKTKTNLTSKSKSSVKCISFTSDGKFLAAGREDGQLDFWLAKKGKLVGSTKLRNTIHKIDWDSTGTKIGAAVGLFGADFVDFTKLFKRTNSFPIPLIGNLFG